MKSQVADSRYGSNHKLFWIFSLSYTSLVETFKGKTIKNEVYCTQQEQAHFRSISWDTKLRAWKVWRLIIDLSGRPAIALLTLINCGHTRSLQSTRDLKVYTINVSTELKTGITSTGSPTSSCCCPNWETEKNKNESQQNSEAATAAFHGCFLVWRSWVNETSYDTKNSGGVYNPWSTDKTLLYSAADGSQQ